jgi:hypothetical protein
LELFHGVQWVQEAVDELIRRGVPDFTAMVLQMVPKRMIERRDWIFIACFCGDGDSDVHWKRRKGPKEFGYGDYCLTFPIPTGWKPTLRCADSSAEGWYLRVIYDHANQRRYMKQAVKAVSDSIARNTRGAPEGPFIDWMAQDCARDAAQILLTIAVGFKDKSYRKDKEWRLVFCPNLALNNSAPNMADEKFKSAIKQSPQRRYIELRVHPTLDLLVHSTDLRMHSTILFDPLSRPQIPFIDIRQSPFHNSAEERARIEEVLLENSSNIKCKSRGWWLKRVWRRLLESVAMLRKRWPISPLI